MIWFAERARDVDGIYLIHDLCLLDGARNNMPSSIVMYLEAGNAACLSKRET